MNDESSKYRAAFEQQGSYYQTRPLADKAALALQYSRNYVAAAIPLAPTPKEHIEGLCDLVEELAAALAAQPAEQPMVPGVHFPAIVDGKLNLQPEQAVGDGVLSGKYGDVLRPFLALMERELHANAGKGDRPGWLAMDRKTALLEIFYHLAKLQKAAKDDDQDGIREYGADVANMAMMLVDVCGALDVTPRPAVATAGDGVMAGRGVVYSLSEAARTQGIYEGRGLSSEADFWRSEAARYEQELLAALASRPVEAAQGGVRDRKVLRSIVDAAWNEATESTQVPATEWADRIIDRVLAAAPEVPATTRDAGDGEVL